MSWRGRNGKPIRWSRVRGQGDAHQFSSLSRVPRSPVFPLWALRGKVGRVETHRVSLLPAPPPNPPPQQGELTYRGTLWSREPRRALQTWEALKWKPKSLSHSCLPPTPDPHNDNKHIGCFQQARQGAKHFTCQSHFIHHCSLLGWALWLFPFYRGRN